MIAVDLSKQKAVHADQKAIQQINSTGNLDWAGGTTIFSITEEAKEIISDFLQLIHIFHNFFCESIVNLICFNIMST